MDVLPVCTPGVPRRPEERRIGAEPSRLSCVNAVTRCPEVSQTGLRLMAVVLRSVSMSMRLVVCLLLLARVDQASANVVHAPDIKLSGWNAAMVGKCRGGTNNAVDVSMELNGKSCSTCGSDVTHMTQKECADAFTA